MLSYQHAYHAGNKADIHKHGFLARILSALAMKDKPLTYLETHSGRGLYDLSSSEALKTGEARTGILNIDLTTLHPAYARIISETQTRYDTYAYPGSPIIAKTILRDCDHLHFCELHPQEFYNLEKIMTPDDRVRLYHADGLKKAMELCPPMPRRGVMMIDPSYEIKTEYDVMPDFIAHIHRKWNVGVIILWYPILKSSSHETMITTLEKLNFPKACRDEIRFDTGLEHHRLKGSGLFIINMPWMG